MPSNKESLLIHFFIFIVIITTFQDLTAQTKTRIYASPENTIVTIDGENVENGALLKLMPGNYRIKLWAPHCEFLDTIVTVTEKPAAIRIKLSLSKIYTDFIADRASYRNTKFKKLIAPHILAFSGTFGLYMSSRTYYLGPQKSLLNKAKDNYNIYNFSLDYREIQRAKLEIKELEQDYKRKRVTHHILTGISIIGSVASSYLIIKRYNTYHKKEKPSYYEEPLLSLRSFGVSSGPLGGMSLSVNFNLN